MENNRALIAKAPAVARRDRCPHASQSNIVFSCPSGFRCQFGDIADHD
jgi:hypothetical protein